METETTVTATSATEETAAPETTPETTAPETEPEETPMHQLTPPLSDFSILNPFSDGELVKSETTGTWQTHNGVDLSCAAGSDVFAIDTGTVSEVCSDALWGYTVTIDHDNGITSRYCGLDGTLEVREGDTVQTGQKLGVTGANPDLESAAEPHLHLEVKKGGAYVDPTAYFG
jgi:murein DD-endopeptidase MepM/ murein hydrolase activator NlpD